MRTVSFHPFPLTVEPRHVLEAVEHEVAAELTVDDSEHVPVELDRDPGGVVVRRLDTGGVLHEVGPEQECVARAESRPQLAEEARALRADEVADRAAEKRDEPAQPLGQPR